MTARVVLAVLLAVAASAAVVWLWPEDAADSPRAVASTPQPQAAPAGPLSRGIERSRVVITVRRDARAYELRGGLDLSEGYRFRGRITKSGYRHLEDGTPIWLAGGPGSWSRPAPSNPGWRRYYDTLTKSSFSRGKRFWLDDHPPTLPLTGFRLGQYDPNYLRGAEVYAHLSLLALKHARHGRALDFAPFARRPPGYSELRKVALAAGETDLTTTVGADGTVKRLRLDLPPATVDVRLFPSDRAIPRLSTRSFAME